MGHNANVQKECLMRREIIKVLLMLTTTCLLFMAGLVKILKRDILLRPYQPSSRGQAKRKGLGNGQNYFDNCGIRTHALSNQYNNASG